MEVETYFHQITLTISVKLQPWYVATKQHIVQKEYTVGEFDLGKRDLGRKILLYFLYSSL